MSVVVIEEQEISLYIISFEVRFRAHLLSSCACDFYANSTVWFPNQNASQYIRFQPELPVESITNNNDKFSV